MARMRQWLLRASELGGVDPRIVITLEPDLLKMASHTAHQLSRPGTPLTAFIAGVAAAQAMCENETECAQSSELTQRQIDTVVESVRDYVKRVLAEEPIQSDDSSAGD